MSLKLEIGAYYVNTAGMLLKVIAGPAGTSVQGNYLLKVLDNPINYQHERIYRHTHSPKEDDYYWYALPSTGLYALDGAYASEKHPLSIARRIYVTQKDLAEQAEERKEKSVQVVREEVPSKTRIAHLSIKTWNTPEQEATFSYAIDFPFVFVTDNITPEQRIELATCARNGFKGILQKMVDFGLVKPDLDDLFKRLEGAAHADR